MSAQSSPHPRLCCGARAGPPLCEPIGELSGKRCWKETQEENRKTEGRACAGDVYLEQIPGD